MSKKAKGSDLVFISRILRDGSGVELINDQEDIQHVWGNKEFVLACLSITLETYIASEFNSYVVKLKVIP